MASMPTLNTTDKAVFHLAISNMAQRHVAFCERHVALHVRHVALHMRHVALQTLRHVALLIYSDSEVPH